MECIVQVLQSGIRSITTRVDFSRV